MIDALMKLSGLNRSKEVKNTGMLFKLLTRYTVNILILFTVIISLKHVFGDPIKCHTTSSFKSEIELKCWLEGVYIDSSLLEGTVGKDITRWGVGPTKKYKGQNLVQLKYYQWIVPVLLFVSLLLYLPYLLWKTFENKLMQQLTKNSELLLLNDSWKNQKRDIMCFFKDYPRSFHRNLFLQYFGCEVFAFGCLIFSMCTFDWILNDFWSEYQPAVAALLNNNMTAYFQHTARTFPTQAKCLFVDFGPSGSSQELDALCFLPQNVVNEKIFVFIYIWFVGLFVVSAMNLVVNIVFWSCSMLRLYTLRYWSSRIDIRSEKNFFKRFSHIGYFFTFYLIHRNLSPVLFEDLIEEMITPEEKKKSGNCALMEESEA